MRQFLFIFTLLFALTAGMSASYAQDCTSPDDDLGAIVYNNSEGVFQGCTQTGWQAFTCSGGNECAAPPSPSCAVSVTSGLIARYPFDETDGVIAHDIVNGYNGVIPPHGTWAPTGGSIGGALELAGGNGTGVIAMASPLLNLDQFTFCTWFNQDPGGSGSGILVSANWDTWRGVTIPSSNNSRIQGWIDTPGDSFGAQSTSSFTPGEWHHACMTFNGSTIGSEIGFYRNGSALALGWDTDGTGDTSANGAGIVEMGGRADGVDYTGLIDEVLIFNRPLLAAEIATIYDDYMNCDSSPPAGPTNCDNIGQQCDDGSFYIGLSPADGERVYMTGAAYETSIRWDEDPPCYRCGLGDTGATSITDGRANVEALRAYGGDNATVGNLDGFGAAKYCDGLNAIEAHGYDDWYLPAGGTGSGTEQNLFWAMVQAEGVIDGIGSTISWYWSSSENSSNGARIQRFSDGTQNLVSKYTTFRVRCVRR